MIKSAIRVGIRVGIMTGIFCLATSNTFASETTAYGAGTTSLSPLVSEVAAGTTAFSAESITIQGIVTSAGFTTYCAPGSKRPITLARHESSIPVDAKDQKKTIPTEVVKEFIVMNLPLILEVDSEDDE